MDLPPNWSPQQAHIETPQSQARGAGNQGEKPEGWDDTGLFSLLNKLQEGYRTSEISCHPASNRQKVLDRALSFHRLCAVRIGILSKNF